MVPAAEILAMAKARMLTLSGLSGFDYAFGKMAYVAKRMQRTRILAAEDTAANWRRDDFTCAYRGENCPHYDGPVIYVRMLRARWQ